MEIVEVNSNRLLRKFIEFPLSLYEGDKNFVPQLYIVQKQLLTNKNPFFDHSQATYFLALVNNRVVGRIAAIQNNIHNNLYNDNCGFFGFFEVVNDFAVAKMLFDRIKDWFVEKGINKILGPTNLTTNDSCGLLVNGYDIPPCILMPYNKDYYEHFLIQLGFSKEIDLYSYKIDGSNLKQEPLFSVFNYFNRRLTASNIVIRPMNYRNFEDEITKMREVYNNSNEGNWGFIPLNEKEFRSMALELKQLVPDKFILIAEKEGKHIGFIVAVPDYNQVFSRIKSGRLFPFGLFKILYFKRKITKARVLILGVSKSFRNHGVDLMLYKKIQENVHSTGIYNTEACYVMETNRTMNSIMKKLGGEMIKTYRIYKYEGSK